MVIYFTRNVHSKLIKYLMVDDCMLDKVLESIKKIMGIEKFDDTEKLFNTNDKLPDDFTLKNIVILMTCIIKDYGKFYLQLFLEEAMILK